jgi:hypothetical protein
MQAFIAFTAQKFGIYKNTSYLCNVRTIVLTTPLSAGSKALSILLQLKATLKGGFYFSYFLRNNRLNFGF